MRPFSSVVKYTRIYATPTNVKFFLPATCAFRLIAGKEQPATGERTKFRENPPHSGSPKPSAHLHPFPNPLKGGVNFGFAGMTGKFITRFCLYDALAADTQRLANSR